MKNQNKYLTYPQTIDKILQDMELVFKMEKQPIGVMLGTNKPKFKNWAIPVLNQMLLKEAELISKNKPDLKGEIPHALHQMLLLDDKDTNSILQDFKSELKDKK